MDEEQEKLQFSKRLHSSHLRSAYFRFENSKHNNNSTVFGYTPKKMKKNLLDMKFGSYRGFSNGSIRNNDSLIANSGWPSKERKETRVYPRRAISNKIRVRF